MKKITSLDELFLHELGDLLNAEQQLVKALPKMVAAAESEELKTAINHHLNVTKKQVSRLEQIFADLDEKPEKVVCKAMKGLIEEGSEALEEVQKGAARDAAIIGAAQKVEHYEISGYGTAGSHASLLGHRKAQELLQETLAEEKEADEKLNELAEGSINSQAKQTA